MFCSVAVPTWRVAIVGAFCANAPAAQTETEMAQARRKRMANPRTWRGSLF
jgi:hypothetical protein